MKLTQKAIESISSLNATKRYIYFVKTISDTEKVYGLYNDGLMISVFYTPGNKWIVPTFEKLIHDIEEECEKY